MKVFGYMDDGNLVNIETTCPADEFEAEIEALRKSRSFQAFLDERMKCNVRFPLEEIEKEIDVEFEHMKAI